MSGLGLFLAITLIVIVFLIAVTFGVYKYINGNKVEGEQLPYYAVDVLSKPEQVLYFRLVNALPDHIVLAQVQVSRILKVKKGQAQQKWRNSIDRLSADFVVCNKNSSVLAVIELDDKSHSSKVRLATDNKKDAAFAAANIPVIRWNVAAMPDEAKIKETFKT